MPRPARTTCKFEGCPEAPYVYPKGHKASYCRTHLRGRTPIMRDTVGPMNRTMKRVLTLLRDKKRQDDPFDALNIPYLRQKTLNAMILRDWVFPSTGIDGTIKYKITGRGEKALKAYETPIHRQDGICPRCNDKPRAVRADGKRLPYCPDCEHAVSTVRNKKYRGGGDPQRLCPRCLANTRHIDEHGKIGAYCLTCTVEVASENERNRQDRLIEAVRNGEPVPLCPKCKLRPRQVFTNYVAHKCAECSKEQRQRRSQERKAEAFRQKLSGVSR